MLSSEETALSHHQPSSLTRQVLEEAATWYANLHDAQASDQMRQQWQEWVDADETHRMAWQRVEQISQRFTHIAQTPSAKALVNVNQQKRKTIRLLSVALVGVGALGGLSQWAPAKKYIQSLSANFHTGVGEVIRLAIAGGGELLLNTNTAINVDHTDHIQHVTLLQGEVMVTMASAMQYNQPLLLTTVQGKIASTQGQFTVRQKNNATYTSVFKGDAVLYPSDTGLSSTTLKAGQQTYFTDHAYGEVTPVDLFRASWSQGLLVADNMPLSEFVEELSRYYEGHIHCDDAVANLRIVGTYSVKNIDQVLTTLQATLPIQIKHVTKWWISITPLQNT